MLDDAIKKYGLMLLITAMLFSLVFTEGGIFGLVKTKMEIGRVNACLLYTSPSPRDS